VTATKRNRAVTGHPPDHERGPAETSPETSREELLREIERLRLVLEASHDGVWEWTDISDPAALSWSPRLFELLGYPDRAFQPTLETFEEMLHPDDRADRMEDVQTALALDQPFETECRLRHRSGEYRWFRVRGLTATDENGRPVRMAGSVRDITERRHAEDALRRSEALYQDLVETSQDLIWQCDAKGRYTYLNPAWEQVFGYEIGEMLGKRFTDFQTADQAERDLEEFARLLQGDVVKGLESVHIGRDGREIHLVFNAKTVVDEDGNPAGTRGTAYDITERKRAEDALRKSELRLRAVLDATPFPVALVDLEDQQIDFWSRSALDLFGHTAPTASEWYEIAYPDPDYRRDVVERWKPMLEEARSTGKAVNAGDYRVTCRDGSVRTCELYAAFLPENLVVTFNDVTERRRAEQRLQESEAFLNRTGEMARVGGWEIDLEAGSVYWSRATRRIHDVPDDFVPTLEEAVSFYPGESGERITEAVERAVELGQPYELELDFVTARGADLRVRAQGIPEMRDGRCVRLWGTFQDITERDRLETALRDLATELSVVEERERRELATFLHDRIGQSLAVLRMRFGDIAERAGKGGLRDRVESMRDLLERAIDETQSLTFQLSPPILYELGLEPALEWLGEHICGEHGLEFEFADDGRAKPLAADVPQLLYRSIRELLINVVKHARATTVALRVERDGDRVRISVADNGVGFEPAGCSVGREMSRFGLFSVRERMAAVGGTMRIDSTPGRGARVILEAPLHVHEPESDREVT
jgi:PAS domain S-box-containing protein